MPGLSDGKILSAVMKKLARQRWWVILLGSVAILALAYLASGLEKIQFQPSQPLWSGAAFSFEVFRFETVVEQIAAVPLWKQVVFWSLLFILVLLFAALLSSEQRKQLILGFIRFALFVWMLLYIMIHYRSVFSGFGLLNSPTQAMAGEGGAGISPPVFTPPHVSSTVSYLVSLVLILTLLVCLGWLGRRLFWRPHGAGTAHPLDEITEIAQSTLDALSTGRDWEDAILQCYLRMSQVVSLRRGLHRQQDMTVNEFALRLERAGLPGEAVRRLTGLFEAVRYGARKSSTDEVKDAAACLSAIKHYCEVKR
jgi:uncharacterized membrane protein